MRDDLDRQLCERHPRIFRERGLPMDRTCMCWGCECGDGWHGLIDSLCTKLDLIERTTGVATVATQVKEKYGTLCFYHVVDMEGAKVPPDESEMWAAAIDALVSEAELRSRHVCEECGEHGDELCRNGWWMARCEKHRKPGDLLRWTDWIPKEEIDRREEERLAMRRKQEAKAPDCDEFCAQALKGIDQHEAGKTTGLEDIFRSDKEIEELFYGPDDGGDKGPDAPPPQGQ